MKGGDGKVERKCEGDIMITTIEVSGRMQRERRERRKNSETCSADRHSCKRKDVSPCTVPT
jgi:hypothetical protein